MLKHLHVISFTIPYPTNEGALVDLFNRLIAWKQLGIQVHLHCYRYDREEQPILKNYCTEVYYYERNNGHKGLSNTLPFIVGSRRNDVLMTRLLEDEYPIWMEGIHCTYLLTDARFSQRKCFVRKQQLNFQYYEDLYKKSSAPFKKLFYWMENRLLKRYEKKIRDSAIFLLATQKDLQCYLQDIGPSKADFLPLFIPYKLVSSLEGMGSFCLYHGDLGNPSNEEAACWLLEKVFNRVKVPFILAGKNPSRKLVELAEKKNNTCLVANPSDTELQDMIAKAHILLVPSFTRSGLKLSLINSLYNGRHCIANDYAVAGTGLEAACHIGTNANAFCEIVAQLYHQPFTTEEIDLRKRLLKGMFENEENARKTVDWIWG
ncbi:MAG: hypothetical protein RLZZ28_905 [Bacteroidota bacterium]|jgi:hypothetical protein